MQLTNTTQHKLFYQFRLVVVLYGVALFMFAYGHHHAIAGLLTASFFTTLLASVGLVMTLVNLVQIKIITYLKNRQY